jgi:hypothetical protein
MVFPRMSLVAPRGKEASPRLLSRETAEQGFQEGFLVLVLVTGCIGSEISVKRCNFLIQKGVTVGARVGGRNSVLKISLMGHC